jgi:hypothetical protein
LSAGVGFLFHGYCQNSLSGILIVLCGLKSHV